MGWKFRKSISVAPGLKINLNKDSISYTIGGKIARYTKNSNGSENIGFSVPETGLYYVQNLHAEENELSTSNKKEPEPDQLSATCTGIYSKGDIGALSPLHPHLQIKIPSCIHLLIQKLLLLLRMEEKNYRPEPFFTKATFIKSNNNDIPDKETILNNLAYIIPQTRPYHYSHNEPCYAKIILPPYRPEPFFTKATFIKSGDNDIADEKTIMSNSAYIVPQTRPYHCSRNEPCYAKIIPRTCVVEPSKTTDQLPAIPTDIPTNEISHPKKDPSNSVHRAKSPSYGFDFDAFIWQCNSVCEARDNGNYEFDMFLNNPDDRFETGYYNAMKEISDTKKLNAPVRKKKKSESKEKYIVNLKNVTITFKDGIMESVSPDVSNYYKAQFYCIDGNLYDSYSIESVNSIPVPDYPTTSSAGTPVYNLEYILHMRASQERKEGNHDLAYALQKKSTQLMEFSNIAYSRNEFMRIVNWLYMDRRFDEAKEFEELLREELPHIFSQSVYKKNRFQKVLNECASLQTDYVYCAYHEGACPECAKYQGRVYCISGNDKRLPELPEMVKRYGGFHEGCIHSFYPHFIGSGSIMGTDHVYHDTIEYSNRPFIDDRSAEDKELYQEKLRNIAYREQRERDRDSYYKLLNLIPEKTPKSFSSFRRAKKENSLKYQELFNIAQEMGIDI